MTKEYDPPLDKGIKKEVEILNENGIETFASCQGGNGHSYPEPTVRFHGDISEGFKAFDIALKNGLNVIGLKRVWDIVDKEPLGAWWEMTFIPHQGS